jgi:hypothetical protein
MSSGSEASKRRRGTLWFVAACLGAFGLLAAYAGVRGGGQARGHRHGA